MSEKNFLKFLLDILTIFRQDVIDRIQRFLYEGVVHFPLIILRPKSAKTVQLKTVQLLFRPRPICGLLDAHIVFLLGHAGVNRKIFMKIGDWDENVPG